LVIADLVILTVPPHALSAQQTNCTVSHVEIHGTFLITITMDLVLARIEIVQMTTLHCKHSQRALGILNTPRVFKWLSFVMSLRM
jgi:hypothetical protein